jgi:spermidine/putrescine transport system ATP-binding protein
VKVNASYHIGTETSHDTAIDVELIDVSRHYGFTPAVDGVSLQVRCGEFATLLGPSGCGKTTLLRLIAGFELPDSGRVMLAGRDVTEIPAHRRNVHTVFQSYALFPHMTVAENVSFGLEQRRIAKKERAQRVRAALAMVRLDDMADRLPATLSGGEQQRVAIARAVVLEPRVLLLDEPLGALDRKLREAMQAELKDLQRRLGIAFVFVTHDQDEALAMSDRVAVMNSGRLEQFASPREIYERPASAFVATFVGRTNLVAALVLGCENGLTTVDVAGGRLQVVGEWPAGAAVTFGVRAERVRLLAVGEAGIPATVTGSDYLGDVTHWSVKLGNGSRWTVTSSNHGKSPAPEPGSRVSLGVAPEDGLLFQP